MDKQKLAEKEGEIEGLIKALEILEDFDWLATELAQPELAIKQIRAEIKKLEKNK